MTIRGFQDLGTIQKVTISKQVNSHSYCYFDLLLKEDIPMEVLYRKIGDIVLVENEERLLLCGRVEQVAGKQTYLKTTLSVTLISCSEKMDKEKQSRIYQSTQKTYGELVACLEQEDVKLQFLDAAVAKKAVPEAILQENQTDFAFLNNIVKELEVSFFVKDTNRKNTVIYIGACMDNQVKVVEPENIRVSRFELEENEWHIQAQIDGYYELGSRLVIDGFDYLVTGLTIVEENQTEYYEYELHRTEKSQKRERERVLSLLGKAKVVENHDPDRLGRIQVEFLEWEDKLPGERQWIPYLSVLTEGAGGIVLLPDPGEIVQVLFQEGKCLAIGCERVEKLEESCAEISARTWSIRGNHLVLSEQGLELKAFQNKATWKEDGIHMENGSFALDLNDKAAKLACSQTALQLNQDILSVSTGTGIALKADKIDLDGGNKVTIKTSKLDIC